MGLVADVEGARYQASHEPEAGKSGRHARRHSDNDHAVDLHGSFRRSRCVRPRQNFQAGLPELTRHKRGRYWVVHAPALLGLTMEARMADLSWDGSELVLRLNRAEKVEAIHGDLRFPASAVKDVQVLDDALGAVDGYRSPGLGFPGVVAVGTYRHGGTKTFAVVHHSTPRGVRVRLENAEFVELIVGCEDPEGTARQLRSRH